MPEFEVLRAGPEQPSRDSRRNVGVDLSPDHLVQEGGIDDRSNGRCPFEHLAFLVVEPGGPAQDRILERDRAVRASGQDFRDEEWVTAGVGVQCFRVDALVAGQLAHGLDREGLEHNPPAGGHRGQVADKLSQWMAVREFVIAKGDDQHGGYPGDSAAQESGQLE